MSDYQAVNESRISLPRNRRRVFSVLSIAVVVIIVLVGLTVYEIGSDPEENGICTDCDTYKPLKAAFTNSLDEILYDREYKGSLVKKLTGAIQIPTEIYDNTPKPSPDLAVWQNFQKLHYYLEDQFPILYETAQVEKVGGYGLLYTWQGQNSSLKPLLLMAHQDVVPVDPNTVSLWTHPPFSGFYNETEDLIYGRGAEDVKRMVISHLESAEKLIKDGFVPQRTVLISLGCDEEASGKCAKEIATHIEKRYGRDSIYAILDEGGGVRESNGSYYGVPVTAEKGYLDAEITLFAPGGHSSVPPDHTSIGILSELMVEIENDTYQLQVDQDNPALNALKCLTKFGAINDKQMEKYLVGNSKEKLESVLDQERDFKYFFKTSQALDIISGGIKANALPEMVRVLLNNRIDINSSVNETLEHILHHVKNAADKYDLGIKILNDGYSKEEDAVPIKPDTANGRFIIKLIDPLEPAPLSPTKGMEAWEIMAGTTVSLYSEKAFGGKNASVYLTPSLSTGNTDTKSFWNLTRNIYRYDGAMLFPEGNAHTVDEKTSGVALVSGVAFMYQFIPNVDFYSTEL
ncbi:LAME_0C08240g1_1 [Lachancea meyersii CBS 8951]|uniref:LAME_0C08240g1_1 n=1 Tax=Lachancea meyersii CBS 8951 TaxID=1266667 RepID=A0A1G4J3R9_9SACH|nr:LAME_0C08240g1_1 [Lachancea meyersii CBS 8951]